MPARDSTAFPPMDVALVLSGVTQTHIHPLARRADAEESVVPASVPEAEWGIFTIYIGIHAPLA
jgi:hypothetical protein